MQDNPYQPPAQGSGISSTDLRLSQNAAEFEFRKPPKPLPGVSPIGTTMARHIAAVLDNVLSAVLSIVVAKQLPTDWIALQIVTMVVVYLGYYFVFESLLSTTPGKLLTGLKILSFDGERCTVKQILIRTSFRLLEVNPFLLGGLPAAARIVCTRDKQRFGDKLAGTIVVFR